jgi:putative tryptophan/tyrosine transport system permease protein
VELWVGAINLGLLYAFMAMGVFITFRIHDFPDITVDGSFVTGAAVTAVLILSGVSPFLAVILSFFAGSLAGLITALVHTRFNINGLLAGILVMTGLYSINLHIMGRSNIPLLSQPVVITYLKQFNPGLPQEAWLCLIFCAFVLIFWALISVFFKTDFGITMRATGNNPTMAGSLGINVNMVKACGIALANGLVGISGSLVAQYQGFADIGMGIGSIVFGLAAVIIGESVLRTASLGGRILSVIVGSIVFRLMVAFALYVGLNPIDLKLITALFVLVVLVAPKMVAGRASGVAAAKEMAGKVPLKKVALGLAALCLVAAIGTMGYKYVLRGAFTHSKKVRIGLVQLTDHALLNITRDSFIEEMKKMGYEDKNNVAFLMENANGDMVTVNSILDKFIHEKVDIILTMSTSCTQAAVNKIKDRPVVFATLANPFIIGAGKSETDHLPNVTGVYGATPPEKMLELVASILPGKIKIGSIWDSSQDNAVYNVKRLKEKLSAHKEMTFVGTTVSSSAEVYQAAVSLANRDINAYVLVGDFTIFSAFESIVKASQARKIPIFIADPERLKDGALGVYGYDYTSSGIQAAHMVDRIIKGEKPAAIPFEQYTKLTVGLNLDTAKKLGITVPEKALSLANLVVGDDKKQGAAPRRLAVFVFSDNHVLKITTDGLLHEFNKSGTLKKYNITLDMTNSHNDFGVAQAIVQDIVRQKYDYIVTIASPALQIAANGNKTIPHVFGAVTNPYRMGIATNSRDHIPNLTGVATPQPVDSTFKAMRAILPRATSVGIVWNPAEPNSEACTLMAREAAKKYGFLLIERTVSGTEEIKDALAALINKKVDIFFTSGDNTVMLAVETMGSVLKEQKIPYFTNDPTDVDRGAFFAIGADYFDVGVETAKMAERVFAGEDTKSIPVRDYVPEKIAINAGLAKTYGLTIPQELLKRAVIVKK